MTKKYIGYATLIISLVIIIYLGRLFIKGIANTFHVPYIALNDDEEKVLAKLSSDCSCRIRLKHNDNLIKKGLTTIDTPNLKIEFAWYNGPKYDKTYKQASDICNWDSIRVIAHALKAASEVFSATPHRDFYKGIDIYYTTVTWYTEDLSISGTPCVKSVSLLKTKDGFMVQKLRRHQ